jgi:hypothetical protein
MVPFRDLDPDLNPHGPDLRRPAAQTLHEIWHIDMTEPGLQAGRLIPLWALTCVKLPRLAA